MDFLKKIANWFREITPNKIALILGYILLGICIYFIALTIQTQNEIKELLNESKQIEQEIENIKNP